MNPAQILIVEDDPYFRNLYQEILSGSDLGLHFFAEQDALLAQLPGTAADLILLDLTHPNSHSPAAFQQGSDPADLLCITDRGRRATAIELLKTGIGGYLTKPFSPQQLQHLVRTILTQRRLRRENIELHHRIRLLQNGQSLAAEIDLDELCLRALATLLFEIGGGRGFAFLDNGGEKIRTSALTGVENDQADALAQRLYPHLIDECNLSVIAGTRLAPAAALPTDLRTLVLVPLVCEEHLKGAIVLINPEAGDFPPDLPLDDLRFLAGQTALGFDNAYRYQGARDLIYTDDLTGLYNYRYLQIVLDQEIRRNERYGLSFSLVFIDIDRFKQVNDHHGHLTGSDVLREFAQLLRKSVREVDIIFRYGGDEFTVLLVEADARAAAVVAERIRASIEAWTFQQAQQPLRLTATVGYATYPDNAADKESLLEMADRAMYNGKIQRNIVRGIWEIDTP